QVLDLEKLTGPQKAAVFLLLMGEEFSSQIFKKMDEDEIGKLASKMAQIQHVPPAVMTQVITEFADGMEDDRVMVKGDIFLKTLTDLGLDDVRAKAIYKEIDRGKKDTPFNYLDGMEAKDIINIVSGEHPQTIALILVYLKPRRAAEVLSGLPKEMQTTLAMRIAEIDRVPGEVVKEVDDALRKELTGRSGSGSGKMGGISCLADILNEVDKETEENVLSTMEEERGDIVEEVRQLMFIFEDLIKVDDRGMREVLKQVESQQLSIALKTASEEMQDKIFGNLSQRAGEMLKEDIEVMGPVKLSEVEMAQQAIIRVARELEAEGKIVLVKGTEDVLV
ncbi:MAG: flagellar motor switch protein FliG, partial [Deltaproteobacteria bacterium]|nr:flagellar motor switch protein FliG [Deltaproteobacteria bacterium]